MRSELKHRELSRCWNETAQTQVLRVELQDGTAFLLPYLHWLFAKWEHVDDRESLVLTFSSHEVRITGNGLRALLLALQKCAVDWIKEIPARYASLTTTDSPQITRIEVVERQNEDQSSEVASRAP